MIDLTQSSLFKEAQISLGCFEKVFQRSSHLFLVEDPTEQELFDFCKTCDYFMVDSLPLDPLFPHRKKLKELLSMEPTLDTFLGPVLSAFFDPMETILGRGCPVTVLWVHENRIPVTESAYLFLFSKPLAMPETKILELFEVFYRVGVRPPRIAMELAIENDHPFVIDWLLCHECPLYSFHISFAIKHNKGPEFLENLIRGGCPTHSHNVATAASLGRMDIVMWWHDKGFPFCSSSAAWAAIWGHTEIIRFLLHHNLSVDRNWTKQTARQYGHLDILELFEVALNI